MSTIRDLWDLGEPWEPQVVRNWGEAISDAVDEVPNRTLDDLSDVDASAPDIGDVIVYDGVNWVTEGTDRVLDDLTDVDVSAASAGDVLVFDGTNWVPGDTDKTLDDLTDVDVSGVQDGEALIYDDGTWVPGESAADLGDLTDVDTVGQSAGDVLGYNGTTWLADSTVVKDSDARLTNERVPTDGSVTEAKLSGTTSGAADDLLALDGTGNLKTVDSGAYATQDDIDERAIVFAIALGG